MATAVIMPKSGQSVESCIITAWNVKEGDSVAIGDILFSYETDKASFEEDAKIEGVMLKILAEEGDDVPCLNNVCIIGQAGEDISKFLLSAKAQDSVAPEAAKTIVKAEGLAAEAILKTEQTDRIFASPRAKMTAEQRGVDVSLAQATGPNGRIIERDVMAIDVNAEPEFGAVMSVAKDIAKDEYKDALSYTDVPLPNIRKVIAKAMHGSLSSMAQLTHHSSFDATAILNYRKALKANAEKYSLANITLNDIILFAVSRTLKKEEHKDLNAHFLGDKMRYFDSVNLGMAVDTPRGLLVPTILNADSKSLNEISRSAKALAKEAQAGTIDPDKLKNGTFTISNLGSLGIEIFTPVINPPQNAILGVNTIIHRLKEDTDGKFMPYPAMGLSLTYNHMALDGAPASRFLFDLCRALENFEVILAK